jgi:hypothetical protein
MESRRTDETTGRIRHGSAVEMGARTLRIIAGAAGLLCAVVAVSAFWTYWSLGEVPHGYVQLPPTGFRVRRGLVDALSSSWGWALVAVVALIGSSLLQARLLNATDSTGDLPDPRIAPSPSVDTDEVWEAVAERSDQDPLKH